MKNRKKIERKIVTLLLLSILVFAVLLAQVNRNPMAFAAVWFGSMVLFVILAKWIYKKYS